MLSSGFYNSKGGDRKYDAEQFGAMFNGLIADGVFAHYKDALKVTAGSGNRELVIKPGRAWFNGTWTEVDDSGHSVYLMGSAVETTYFVYLAINKSDRKNTIAWYSSIANNDPEKGLYFYLLAQVTVPGGATKISDSMITDTRGSDLCPYVTGIMETVSFEELVKRVCGDNWQDWLGVYEAGITTGVQNAMVTAERALDEVRSLKSYAVESEAVSYIWAKFEAVPTGGGGFEWATDSVHTELTDPPVPMYLFRDLSYADLGPGFKPNISLNSPYIAEGDTAVKAIPAVTQSKVWREYPYFWEGGAAFGTEVLRYDDLQRVVVNVGGVASEKYRYRVSRLMHIPVTYEPGAYIGTVNADNATAYPRDGYKDGYYYMRFAAKAEDVSFYYPGLSAKNVRDAIIEVVKRGGNGSGSAMSVKEVEELPPTGIKGVLYVVKKSGDTDASEYLWLDRWEKVGGSDSLHNVVQSSWAQNDPEAPDYVKHRTHYEENNQTVIEWDGNTEGRDTFPDSPNSAFYRISGNVPTVDEVVGGSFAYVTPDGIWNFEITDAMCHQEDGVVAVGEDVAFIYIVAADAAAAAGFAPGIYSIAAYEETVGIGAMLAYVSSLTYGSTVVHQLDEKWIPDSIARKADVLKLDDTMTQSGKAADAKAVGDAISKLSGQNPDEIRAAVFEYMEQDATGAVVAVDAQEPTAEDNTTYIVMQSHNGTIFRLAIGDDGLPFVTNEAGATVWSGASGGSGGGDTGGGEDSGGDDSTEIPENVEGVYTNNVITEVPAKAFQGNKKLTGVNLPNVTTVGEYAFCGCDGLTKLVLPKCASVGTQGIALCANLRVIDLGGVPVGGLGYQSLTNSKNLETLILRCDSTVWGCAAMSIGGTKLEEDTGYVYVPTKMVDAYTAHNIWKGYSIRALEDYTVDGSSTGELDATKTGGAV